MLLHVEFVITLDTFASFGSCDNIGDVLEKLRNIRTETTSLLQDGCSSSGSPSLPRTHCTACVGCDIVQADHAPEAGVAQVIFHGILVRHHGRNQEEVEEGLEEEVERDKEEDAQTTTCTCMDGMR